MYDHLYLPNEFTNLIDNTEKYFTVAPSEIFMRMAILSQDALADHSAPFTEKIIQAAFLKGLNQKELLTFNLKLNLSGYLDLLKQTNQSEVVIKAILRLSSIRTPEQLLNGISNKSEVKPFARLLLVNLLFDSWRAFKDQCRFQEALAADLTVIVK